MTTFSRALITAEWRPPVAYGDVLRVHSREPGVLVDVDLDGITELADRLREINRSGQSLDAQPVDEGDEPTPNTVVEPQVTVALHFDMGRTVGPSGGHIAEIHGADKLEPAGRAALAEFIRDLIRVEAPEQDYLDASIDDVLEEASRAIASNSVRGLAAWLAELNLVVKTVLEVWQRRDLRYSLKQASDQFGWRWPMLSRVQQGYHDLAEAAFVSPSGTIVHELFNGIMNLGEMAIEAGDFYVVRLFRDLHRGVVQLAQEMEPGRISRSAKDMSWRHLAEQLWALPPATIVFSTEDLNLISDAADSMVAIEGVLSEVLRVAIESEDVDLYEHALKGMAQRLAYFDSRFEGPGSPSLGNEVGSIRRPLSEAESARLETRVRVLESFETLLFLQGAWIVRRYLASAVDPASASQMLRDVLDQLRPSERLLATAVRSLGRRLTSDLDSRLLGANWWLFDQLPEGEPGFIDSDSDLADFFWLAFADQLYERDAREAIKASEDLQRDRRSTTQAFAPWMLSGFVRTARARTPRAYELGHLIGLSDDRMDAVSDESDRRLGLVEERQSEIQLDSILGQQIDPDKTREFKQKFLRDWQGEHSIRREFERAGTYGPSDERDQPSAVQTRCCIVFKKKRS